jgi:hypothetical protein
MSSPLQGEPERHATAAIGGILYQIWQSVLAWISLETSEILYLEGAEDFDVIGLDQATPILNFNFGSTPRGPTQYPNMLSKILFASLSRM